MSVGVTSVLSCLIQVIEPGYKPPEIEPPKPQIVAITDETGSVMI